MLLTARFVPYLLKPCNWATAGVREDTPDDIKEEYEEYVKWVNENPKRKC